MKEVPHVFFKKNENSEMQFEIFTLKELFNNFKSLLEKNFIGTRNANDYAAMLYLSYKHLNEICKSLTGNSAKKFIDIFVTLEIKRYLATSDL